MLFTAYRSYRSPLDMLFQALEEEEPNHVAVKQYKVFKQAAGVINYKRFLIQSYERQPMAA